MAQQLRARGEEVGLLALIDAWAPGDQMREETRNLEEATISYLFVKNLGRCRGRDLPVEERHFAGLDADETAKVALTHLRELDPIQFDGQEAAGEVRRLRDVYAHTLRAFIRYELRPYPGKAVRFHVAERAAGHYRPPTLRWNDLTGELVEGEPLPGNHFTMVYEPHVRVLAARLRVFLDGAQP
jgi:thioesterase domain-containing protein